MKGSADMAKAVALLAAAVFAAAPAPALAGASDFILVNGTTSAMESVSIRRFPAGAWQRLPVSPRAGGRITVPFKDEDCAFDIRATLTSRDNVIWSGVNLCEATAVILNRDDSGRSWVDYD